MKISYQLSLSANDYQELQQSAASDSQHPHIHLVDLPFRLTSSWQDSGCELASWYADGQLLAWGVFLPAWWNFDCAITPALRGSQLEKEVFTFGIIQMQDYSEATGEQFWGSIELFADDPSVEATIANLASLGFKKFDWSTLRFELDLAEERPQMELPNGFSIRPLRGASEITAYVALQRAAFDSQRMTSSWRQRTLTHPGYRPEIDLVVVDESDQPVGFCVCWLWNGVGHIEPLGIHPDYQGLGLGRALEIAALNALQAHGGHTVCIDHTSFNKTAINLSLKNGFRQINEALRFYIEVGH